ncbi:WD40/YVTN/BNR-like repeat-containing protein [Sinimarinibacterium thermocellulolyticum]|uniref:YCF48-related protein n=1 Tax=Sinimarinibacterium thermocellulolyticum TaxID=3170016 RepID=A0ABV2AC01_9GAMM
MTVTTSAFSLSTSSENRLVVTPLLRWFASVLLLSSSIGAHAVATASPAPEPAVIAPRAAESLLTAITRAGARRLVAVGSRGHILLSDDSGEHWRQVASPVSSLLTAVTFLDAQTGWAVGHDGIVLKTTDGGETWRMHRFDPTSVPLLDVMFLDAQRGFALGAYGTFLTSEDGGETWQAVDNALTEEGKHLNAIARLADGRLLIVGELGLIGVSADEGRSWMLGALPYEGSLFAVQPYGAHGAIVGGLRGNSFWSLDVAADGWTRIETGSLHSVFGIAEHGAGFILVGFNASAIVVTADGDVRTLSLRPLSNGFVPARSIEASAFSDVVVLDNGELITVGDAGVRRWAVEPD